MYSIKLGYRLQEKFGRTFSPLETGSITSSQLRRLFTAPIIPIPYLVSA